MGKMLRAAANCLLVSFFLIFCIKTVCAQNIRITEHTSFHDATWGPLGELEDVSTDSGGVLTFFVKNEHPTLRDSIISVRFSVAGSYYDSTLWRVWPYEMAPAGQPGDICAITVKGFGYPFRENDNLKIEVWSANGGHDEINNFQNLTPELRIGNVLPNHEMDALYIYLRNDGASDYQLGQVFINGEEFTAASARISVYGGSFTCTLGNILILKIGYPEGLTQCTPLALAVHGTRMSDSYQSWTSAGIRVVDPDFPLGTWHSSLLNPGNDIDRITLRTLHVNSTHGVGNAAHMDTSNQKYFLRGVWEPDFGTPFNPSQAAAVVDANKNADYVHVWAIDDEPDLNGKDIAEQLIKNQTYWENDPNTPSYVNLAVQKKFNRYGWYADIVGMDHYAAPNAPNIIPLTWVPVVGRPAEIEEALEYTEYLKLNTEPRRMWAWCQLANGGWGQQPTDYADNYQFWAHIMGGAKGIHWFTAKPNHPEDFPEQWAEAIKLTKQFMPVRNLCFYGEPTALSTTSTADAVSRLLIGPEAMVLVVVNNTIDFTWNGSFNPLEYNSDVDSVFYTVEFNVPSWISPDDIFQITEEGRIAAGFTVTDLGNSRYRISAPVLYKNSHVFVIGKRDVVPPDDVTGLNVAYPDSCALSWQAPFDNFGIQGYILRYNGMEVDTVTEPVYFVDETQHICDTALWEVIAFDAAGNLSTDTISNSTGELKGNQGFITAFPNPSTGTVSVLFNGNTAIDAELFDIRGNLVLRHQLSPGEKGRFVIQLDNYESGVYLLKARNAEEVSIAKIILLK